MCYKIVFRLINVDFHTFFRLAPSNNTRGHGYKLFVEQSIHNVRYYFLVGVWLMYGTIYHLILIFFPCYV